MKRIQINVVKGAEGSSLNVMGKDGGLRVSGPKAWGNPFNEPTFSFEVDAEELIQAIQEHIWEEP